MTRCAFEGKIKQKIVFIAVSCCSQLLMIRPNSFTLPPRIGHTECLAAWWNWQHAVFGTAGSTPLSVSSERSTPISRSQCDSLVHPRRTTSWFWFICGRTAAPKFHRRLAIFLLWNPISVSPMVSLYRLLRALRWGTTSNSLCSISL